MQSKGFSAIHRYMAECNNIDDSTEMAVGSGDQKVPQYSVSVDTEDALLSMIKSEEPIDPPSQLDIKSILDLSPTAFAPIPGTTCTYVNSISDQQITRDGSPTLIDMDNFSCLQDMSFYAEVAQMKDNKTMNYSVGQPLCQDDMYFSEQSFDPLEQAELSLVSESHIKQEIVDMQYYNFWDSQSEYSDDSYSESSRDALMGSIIENVQQHIRSVANDLDISEDPENWTSCDVQKWVLYHTQTTYPDTYKQFLQLSGNELCNLTEVDFLSLDPETGTNLYSQLEIWKNAPRPMEPVKWRTLTETQAIKGKGGIQHKQTIHLWQFLRDLLEQPGIKCIKWTDRIRGIFKIEDSAQVAKLWGRRKNRPKMDYDKLSRSIRQYYKKGIIRKTEQSKRLVYQFCPDYL